MVADPEDVPDANGHLPADRRFTTLHYYRRHRIDEVTKLRARLPELEVALGRTEDEAERWKLRAERDVKKARIEKVRQMFEDMLRRNEVPKAAATPPPPKPVAVIPSGLPIGEVIERLQVLRATYPAAEARRGRANRWELWPNPTRLMATRHEIHDDGLPERLWPRETRARAGRRALRQRRGKGTTHMGSVRPTSSGPTLTKSAGITHR